MLKTVLLALLLLWLLPLHSSAMLKQTCPGGGSLCNAPVGVVVGGIGYTGPGDLVGGAQVWFGLRCYSSAQANLAKAARLQRASDSTQQDIGLLANCNFDTPTANTFCASTTCTVVKLYNQGSQGATFDMSVQGTAPAYTPSCLNNHPCLTFPGSNNDLASSVSSSAAIAGPCSETVVFNDTGNSTPQQYHTIFGAFNATDFPGIYTNNGLLDWFLDVDGNLTGTTFNNNYAVVAVNFGTGTGNGFVQANGSFASTNSNDANCASANWYTTIGQSMIGTWAEGGLWNVAFTNAQLNSQLSNMRAYYSF